MKLSKKQDDIKFGHDYIPSWPSQPGTIIKIMKKHNKTVAILIEYYDGGRRWYGIDSFLRNFEHYQNCIRCREIRIGEKK